MSTKREPLLSHAKMRAIVGTGREDVDMVRMVGAIRIASEYEAARQKDADLIQVLVDRMVIVAKADRMRCGPGPCHQCEENAAMLAAAEEAGFKPTQP